MGRMGTILVEGGTGGVATPNVSTEQESIILLLRDKKIEIKH